MLTIKILRLLRGQSQWQLGQAAQITNYKLSQIERGKLEPTPAELDRLAATLDVTPEVLKKEISKEILVRA